MKELMIKLAAHLKAMNLCYHNAHHLVGRIIFFSDHEALSSFYKEVDGDFDDVMERTIGLFGQDVANLQMLMQLVNEKTSRCPSTQSPDNTSHFAYGLELEKELCGLASAICKSPEASEGTKQLVGGICDKSESRQYKLKQRIKK